MLAEYPKSTQFLTGSNQSALFVHCKKSSSSGGLLALQKKKMFQCNSEWCLHLNCLEELCLNAFLNLISFIQIHSVLFPKGPGLVCRCPWCWTSASATCLFLSLEREFIIFVFSVCQFFSKNKLFGSIKRSGMWPVRSNVPSYLHKPKSVWGTFPAWPHAPLHKHILPFDFQGCNKINVLWRRSRLARWEVHLAPWDALVIEGGHSTGTHTRARQQMPK